MGANFAALLKTREVTVADPSTLHKACSEVCASCAASEVGPRKASRMLFVQATYAAAGSGYTHFPGYANV